jgi:uncharacterized protein YjbJ (UPF0337 family)
MMNDNQLKGHWAEIKGELIKVWGQLSGDELEETNGDLTAIGGLIRQKYGLVQEDVHQRLNDVIAGFRRKLKEDVTEDSEPSARAEREDVHGSLRDQYRQF